MTSFQKAILSTIIYYDALDYPLTFFEIFKYLTSPKHLISSFKLKRTEITLEAIIKNLKNRELSKFINEKDGFYFLKSREEIIRTRIDRQKIADQKWKKARRIIKWLQVIPYLRMVAVSGSLALNNTKEESDFDLFIVVKNKRIWLSRFLVTGLLQAMGKRRYKNFTKDRICLNHYVTDKSLKIKFKSLYNAQTYAHMIPVLEIKDFSFQPSKQGNLKNRGIYKKFQEANSWIKDYLVFWPKLNVKHVKALKINYFLIFIARGIEFIFDNKLGDFLEKSTKKIQEPLIKKNPLTYKKGGRITADDTQLEFHPDSPEKKTLDKYNKNVLDLKLKELKKEKDSGLL